MLEFCTSFSLVRVMFLSLCKVSAKGIPVDKPSSHNRVYWGRKFRLSPGQARNLTPAMLEQLENAKSDAARRLLLFGMFRRKRGRGMKTKHITGGGDGRFLY